MASKTESLRNTIFKAILHDEFPPGSKVPTEREMVERTGTSRVTVRRAYEQLHVAGILERQQGRGTFVARHAGGNPDADEHIALLTSVSERFGLEFISALEKALIAEDLLLILRLTDDAPGSEEQAAIGLVAKGIRNLVIWPSGHSFPGDTFARLRVLGVNMVLFDRMLPGAYADYVGLDNPYAMDQLFAYAMQRGIRHPVFATHAGAQADSDNLRRRAFLRACARHGLPGTVVAVPRDRPVTALPPGITDDSTLFCVNDAMALSLKPHLRDQQILGFDGLTDTIVSCAQPLTEMAHAAVSLLLRQRKLGATWRPVRRLFKGTLVNT